MDHFVDRLANLDFDIVSLADNANVDAAQLTQQIQRRLWLLPQRQPLTVFLTTLLHSSLNVLRHTIKPVRRTRTFDPLMRALVIVISHPMIQPLTRVSERSKHSLFQKLAPDRLPEPLDLAQGHRVLRRRPHMLDTALFQGLLELGLTAPGGELAAVVTEDLARCTPLADRPFNHFHHRSRGLLAEQSPAHHVPTVVVDDAHQIDLVHALEVEREDVDLPHRIGYRTLKAPDFGRAFVGPGWWAANAGGIDCLPDLLWTD